MDSQQIPNHLSIPFDLISNNHQRKMLNLAAAAGQNVFKAAKDKGNLGRGWRILHKIRDLRNK
jgi:hypothetical protein